MKTPLIALAVLAFASSAPAAIILFDLIGTGGAGLLTTNEPTPPAVGGSGGEILGGITFNDLTLSLSIDVGWGSSQGFTNLSSVANGSHLHGPTTNNNGNNGTANWRQTAGVLFSLTRSSDAVTGGQISQSLTLTAAQQTDLYNGKYYINVHTATNGGGEINGFLTRVPEPTTGLLGMVTVGLLGLRRRR